MLEEEENFVVNLIVFIPLQKSGNFSLGEML